MQLIKEHDYKVISTFVELLDENSDLSIELQERMKSDERFYAIVCDHFDDVSECERFIQKNSRFVKHICADIDCYATAFECTITKHIEDDDEYTMLTEITNQFKSNLRNYLECIEIEATDFSFESRTSLISYDEYLRNSLVDSTSG